MNKSLLELNIDIERAVRFLCEYLPESERGSRKPILAHNLRVGQDVYQRALENNYSNEGVIGAFLHDILEWSRANDTMLKKNFGKEVYRLVLANTKDRSIQDGGERITELTQRCAQEGKEAFIIRVADTLDSFRWYNTMKNEKELQYCRRSAQAILEYKQKEWSDLIFEEVKNVVY